MKLQSVKDLTLCQEDIMRTHSRITKIMSEEQKEEKGVMDEDLGYKTITPAQVSFLLSAIHKGSKTVEDVCMKFGVDRIEDVPFEDMTDALNFSEHDWQLHKRSKNKKGNISRY